MAWVRTSIGKRTSITTATSGSMLADQAGGSSALKASMRPATSRGLDQEGAAL